MEKSTSEERAEVERLDYEANKQDDWIHNMSKRGEEWLEFATEVGFHIEKYAVPQYGDMPNDQMSTASLADIKHNIMRYMNRLGSNARGEKESVLDMIKVAHYACIAASKLREGNGVS